MPQFSRTLLRAAVLAVSSAAAVASAGAAHADAQSEGAATAAKAGRAATSALIGTVNHVPVNPFAQTSVNPLDNSVGSQVADFKPVSTADVTKPVADSRTVSDLPLLGDTVRTLQGG
ncbi:hypothetical protein [Actinacidiphila glaucinigra]|uniref:hypothetical protein n=1 Tax=Actinacidiphila glaucinigra TaxID=235986 RepID=UPI0036AE48B5